MVGLATVFGAGGGTSSYREVEDADGSYAARLSTHPEQHGHMEMQDFRAVLVRLPDDQREALVLVGAAVLGLAAVAIT